MEKGRTRRLADSIERELRSRAVRELRVPLGQIESPARWRRAAVMAAHRIGFRATTLVWGDTLVLVVHKPVAETEDRLLAEATAASILGGGSRPH